MVNQMFPAILAGLLLASVLAAIMSTADSQLLVTASSLTEDFYKVLFRKNATDKELILISRLSVIVIAISAYLLALNENSSILKIVSYAWAGFGATFGPAIIISLFWKRMTRNGALAGMISGGVLVIIWKQLSGGIFDLYEIVPGFIVSAIAIIIFSLLDKQPDEVIIDEFEQVCIENNKYN
jgi:sodium/proline symporter